MKIIPTGAQQQKDAALILNSAFQGIYVGALTTFSNFVCVAI